MKQPPPRVPVWILSAVFTIFHLPLLLGGILQDCGDALHAQVDEFSPCGGIDEGVRQLGMLQDLFALDIGIVVPAVVAKENIHMLFF